MIQLEDFPEDAIVKTIDQGEIPEHLRRSADQVAVVWTQDWCPQWTDMKRYLPELQEDVRVFVLEYNRHPDFEKILEFKEEVWENREIPYIRYYRGGELKARYNWLPKNTFSALMKK